MMISKFKKGFTMIELLIVIAVLGVLAVAVLSAINPIEQINRGRDTGSRSDAEQLLSAIDRYNASRPLWPWQDVSTDEVIVAWQQVTLLTPIGSVCPMLDNLRFDDTDAACPGADEVKMSFINRIVGTNYNALYTKFDGGAGDSVYVCFSPRSRSFSLEANTRCLIAAEAAELGADACGGCDDLNGASGTNVNCICLP